MTADPPPASRPPAVVRVRRTGGFIGRAVDGEVDLASADPRVPEVVALLASVDPRTAPAGRPHPDMYSYEFDLGDGSAPFVVPEHLLPDALRSLATLLLDPSR